MKEQIIRVKVSPEFRGRLDCTLDMLKKTSFEVSMSSFVRAAINEKIENIQKGERENGRS